VARRDGDSLATILLTTRLVDAPAPPLSASDFWQLRAAVDEPGRLLGAAHRDIESLLEGSALDPERIRALLDRATSVALEVERLVTTGVSVVTVFERGYPSALIERLDTGAPALLHVVGDASLMSLDLLGVVGSRDLGEEGGGIAEEAAREAAARGWGVVSGGAPGIDRLAMTAATDADGCAVGMLADALTTVVQEPELRRLVADGHACLATAFPPATRFTPANAMARDELIHGLARRTFVVASDHDTGGTRGGAEEALGRSLRSRVDVWTGPGAGPGNDDLVARGGRPITNVADIFDQTDPDATGLAADPEQLNLGV
jgi:DNA processing protein